MSRRLTNPLQATAAAPTGGGRRCMGRPAVVTTQLVRTRGKAARTQAPWVWEEGGGREALQVADEKLFVCVMLFSCVFRCDSTTESRCLPWTSLTSEDCCEGASPHKASGGAAREWYGRKTLELVLLAFLDPVHLA